ncbi:hypothetical protein EAE90_02615 [Photorhabdus caribbeanensis]|nr:hypothetical protein [Photorhabdus caribbeanensis]MBS9422658.1 hypothetical protein [Photorhabdus caribbeanensis]
MDISFPYSNPNAFNFRAIANLAIVQHLREHYPIAALRNGNVQVITQDDAKLVGLLANSV